VNKKLIPFILLLILIISACGNKTTGTSGEETKKEEESTITYESENGPIEVPADPQRVVALTNAGYVLKLGVNLVGVDSWSMTNPRYADELKDVEVVSEENIEKIAELQPDLIIAASTTKNIDKLGKIAPTVTYTYNKVDYLTQHLEIGKLLNKEKEAQAWIDDFKARAKAAGEEIKSKIGEDATVTVLESYDKSMYILGDSWGRGTEILYQAMGLKMPENVKEMTGKEGYYTLSSEVLPEYVGDYLVISKYNDQDNSYQETDVYKEIPAVKNNQVLEANAYEFIFNDPISLDYQLDFFKENFLK